MVATPARKRQEAGQRVTCRVDARSKNRWLVPGLIGGAGLSDRPECSRQPDLLRARRRDRLPIHGVVHHLAHALEPPLCPAQPSLAPSAAAHVSETQFHLSIEHIYPFFCARSYEGHMDKYCPGRKNVSGLLYKETLLIYRESSGRWRGIFVVATLRV